MGAWFDLLHRVVVFRQDLRGKTPPYDILHAIGLTEINK
jgi:hypothetical protein